MAWLNEPVEANLVLVVVVDSCGSICGCFCGWIAELCICVVQVHSVHPKIIMFIKT
jgi:hypothetical protein